MRKRRETGVGERKIGRETGVVERDRNWRERERKKIKRKT